MVKAWANSQIDWRDATEQIRRRVSVEELLRDERCKVRGRGRADCPLCEGSSRGTIAYKQEVWHCHRCGRGGSVFDLIMAAHGCDFKRAQEYLAQLARVELPTAQKLSLGERRRIAEEHAQRKRVSKAAAKLEAAERGLRLQYCDLIHQCERKQREVSARLWELMNGAPEQWRGEREGCWNWLDALASLLRGYIAAYWILSFASARDRATIALRPEMRQPMINRVLLSDGVDDDGNWMGVWW